MVAADEEYVTLTGRLLWNLHSKLYDSADSENSQERGWTLLIRCEESHQPMHTWHLSGFKAWNLDRSFSLSSSSSTTDSHTRIAQLVYTSEN